MSQHPLMTAHDALLQAIEAYNAETNDYNEVVEERNALAAELDQVKAKLEKTTSTMMHVHEDRKALLDKHNESVTLANAEIKRLSDRLDAIRHQQAELSLVEAADKYAELEKEKATLETEIERLRSVQSQKLSKEAQKLMSLPFRRAITKKEQADMGKLKKSVRGLVVVHPMTALGREMGLKEMTGFARSEF